VATRFGVPEKLIAQRLKLGRLSPVILDAYRKAEIDLETAQAFAICDDHAAQERVLADLQPWNLDARSVRRALTEGEIRATDKRVVFVGLDAYEAAGGAVRRDLFGDDKDAFLLDRELLDRLAVEKLASVRDQVAAEGWRWTETVIDLDYETFSSFRRRRPDRLELSEADQDELDRLSLEHDQLAESTDESDLDCLFDIEQRIEEIKTSAETWSPETLAIAGAIVSLDHDGSVSVERGLVRKEDLSSEDLPPDDCTPETGVARAGRNGLSPTLVADLTAHKSAAIAAELMAKPDVALAAVVHSLTLRAFYEGSSTDSCLQLSSRSFTLLPSLTDRNACTGFDAIKRQYELVHHRLPGDPLDLWQWCLNRSHDELLDLLALITATSVNAVQQKHDRADAPRFAHAGQLADALKLDMTAWFTPTAESYFSRVTRAQILAAIDEAKGQHGPALDKLKKTELAARAEALVAGTGWLPEPLRILPHSGPADTDHEALAAE
jgi:ParB family chromosome partitioning protein